VTTFNISADAEWDDAAFATRAGNDLYTVAGAARLTIACDTRYCANSDATKGAIGSVTLWSPPYGGGGEWLIEGRNVRIIPYDTGTGNVPAIGTSIVQGGVSGPLLGVWSAFNVAPTAAGAAMPAAGWVKIKAVTGGAYAAGALTGIGANATGPDIVGWLEIIGAESGVDSLYYKNSFRVQGEWFTHPTLTDGVNTTTYQLPASLANTYYAGCEVETAPGSGVYEAYDCMGSLAGAGVAATDAMRGKVCWISSQGLLRLGYDGANTNGYLPEAGCRIRVPNINLINAPVAALSTNAVPNATATTRHRFVSSPGMSGSFVMDKCNCAWYALYVSPYALAVTNSFFQDLLSASKVGTRLTLTNVHVGQTAAQVQVGFSLYGCRQGGDITDCSWTRYVTATNSTVVLLQGCAGLIFTRDKAYYCALRTTVSASYTTEVLRSENCVWISPTYGTSIGMYLIGGGPYSVYDYVFFDTLGDRTTVAQPLGLYAMMFTYLDDLLVDGFSFGGLAQQQPAVALFHCAGGSPKHFTIRNIGAPGAPLDLGGPEHDSAWSRVTTTLTVAQVAHGLLTGDVIFVLRSDSPATFTAIAKNVTRLTDDTFSFVCTDAGPASGVLTYYQLITGNLLLTAGNANTFPQNLIMQRVYTDHSRISGFPLLTNEMNGARLENIGASIWSPALVLGRNVITRGAMAAPTLAAQLASPGSLWIDNFYPAEAPVSGATWTSTSTTATVTQVGHGLINSVPIVVTDCSNTPRIFRGLKATITVIDSDTFTFGIDANTGAASGTLDYERAGGLVGVLCNDPTPETADQVSITAGTPVFSGAGFLFANTAGDQVTWEMPDYVIGHSGFLIIPPGVGAVGGGVNEWQVHEVEYQIDKNDGAGWSAWKSGKRVRAFTGSSGSTTISCAAGVAGLEVDDYVGGQTGIAGFAKIASIDTANDVTLDLANVAALGGGNSWVTHLPSETGIDAERGFKLRIRTTIRAAGTVYLAQIYFWTRSTPTSRAYQYPLVSTSPVHRPIRARHVS